MLLTEKYKYNPLARVNVEGKRHYRAEGNPLPSVTTILSALKDQSGLDEWRNRIGHKEANEIMNIAASIGTSVHSFIEYYILDENREIKNNYINKIGKKLSDIVIEKGLCNIDEVWGTEIPLYNPGLYAGTADCVGVWKGKHTIIDFKTSRKAKKEEWIEDYFIQGCLYALAHNEVYKTSIRTVVIMMIGWDGDNEGNYQEFVIDGLEFDRYAIMASRKVAEYYDRILI
jgi:hypothetical protein